MQDTRSSAGTRRSGSAEPATSIAFFTEAETAPPTTLHPMPPHPQRVISATPVPRPGVLHHHLGTQPLQAPHPLYPSLGGRWHPPTSGALTALPSPGDLPLAPIAESATSVAHSTGRHTPTLIPDRPGGRPHPDPGPCPQTSLQGRPLGAPAGRPLSHSGPRPLFLPRLPAAQRGLSEAPIWQGPPPFAHSPGSLFCSKVGKSATPRSRGRAPSRATSVSVDVRMIWLQAGPHPTRGRTRSPCSSHLQPNEAQPPAARSADRSGFVATRGPSSGRGTGRRLPSTPV
ncbi:hypothetical protein NDU88_003873 [Pleurodeles waltl]|uniref:Uncharacterized protein n=1 Tax=Pleurodeles waltl TaxID=8319 RepID=A0AAV7RE57_PLEWA|nr:hypothetical protein NDU88_003873 [Pleurodeles waltl]